MIRAIDHVVIAVEDLEEAALHYSVLFGRCPSWSGEHPEWGTANVLFKFENIYVELLAQAGNGPLADAVQHRLETSGEGLVGIAFATDDADACAAGLRAHGIAASDPIEGAGANPEGKVRRWRNVLIPADASRGVMAFAIEHLEDSAPLPLAQAVADAPVAGVDHIVILSKAPDATKKFYGDTLGIRLALDQEKPEWGARQLFFKIAGVVLEVGASLKDPPDESAPDNAWGICWGVDDAVATRERLAAAGVDVSEVRDGRKPGTRVCTVRSQTHGVASLLLEVVR